MYSNFQNSMKIFFSPPALDSFKSGPDLRPEGTTSRRDHPHPCSCSTPVTIERDSGLILFLKNCWNFYWNFLKLFEKVCYELVFDLMKELTNQNLLKYITVQLLSLTPA